MLNVVKNKISCTVYLFLVSFTVSMGITEEFKELEIENQIYNYLYNEDDGTVHFGNSGIFILKEDALIINCSGSLLDKKLVPSSKEAISPELISLEECILEEKPIADILEAFNINVTAVKKLRISIPANKDHTQAADYNIGLDLDTLWLDIGPLANVDKVLKEQDYFKLDVNIKDTLLNLKTLIVDKLQVPTLPKETRLEVLSLRNFAHIRIWDGYCNHLKELSVYRTEIPTMWSHNCSQLDSLKISHIGSFMTPESIVRSGINSSCVNLRFLSIHRTRLHIVPSNLMISQQLISVNLSYNDINDTELLKIPVLPNLAILDLSTNKLTGSSLFDFVKSIPGIRYLNLGNNRLTYLYCNAYEPSLKSLTMLKSLEALSLAEMLINVDCFKGLRFAKLQHLDMGYTGFWIKDQETRLASKLELRNLPDTNASRLEIDLRGRPFEIIKFQPKYYEFLETGIPSMFDILNIKAFLRHNITVLLDPIDCDCEHYWIGSAIRNIPNFISMPGLRCNNTGEELIKTPLEDLDCLKETRSGCIVRSNGTWIRRYKYPSERVDCHNADEENSKYPINDENSGSGYVTISLNASNNHMSNLKKIKFPKTMKWVDLSKNIISYLDANDTTRLFSLPERRVWLSKNLFVCNCTNAQMIDTLHLHRDQIVDFDEIICIDTGVPVRIVSSYEVCQYGLRTALASTGTLAALLIIAVSFVWRFRFKLKIYLYSRGWCLCCFHDEDEDSEKPYDAFLSFANDDFDYVTEVLLPKLEGEPNSFRVCVHYRDWVIGEWIPAQILRSVSLSKRTIIVLSQNFVKSMWSSLEFRYAASHATKVEGLNLLVLVLDDVLSDEELDPELRGYISYYTYLRCDDPWFWEKLRYAMPQRKLSATPTQNPEPMAATVDPIIESQLIINPQTHEVAWNRLI